MRQFLKEAEKTLVPTETKPPVVPTPTVDQPDLVDDSKLIAIASDFYKATGKQLDEDKAKKIAEFYKGDYNKMVSDLYKATGKEVTTARLNSIKKYYKLVEDVPNPELPKEIIDYSSKVDELENNIETFKSYNTAGLSSEGRHPDPNFADATKESIGQFTTQKDSLTDSFSFKPITLKEVVNTVGKGKDDVDEVSQSSKLYLEKYTNRMKESLSRYEQKLSPTVSKVVDAIKNGELDPASLDSTIKNMSAPDALQFKDWQNRANVVYQQDKLNNETIYKKEEFKRQYNNAAREAIDNNENVIAAVLNKANELGDTSDWVKELANKGEASNLFSTEGTEDSHNWVSTSLYNTTERVQNSLLNTWRGIKEAFDGWGEKSTVYNESFMKDFDNYLNSEVWDKDVKRLLWGTNKSKYDGDIHEKKVDVDGVQIILDDKGNATGVRRPNGNMAFNFKEDEIKAIQKYEKNKDELKKEAYHSLRLGTLGAKGTQVMTDMIPIVGATLATGGVGGTMLGTYAVSYGDYYNEQFAKTGSVGNASAFATTSTLLQGMLEGIGGIEGSIIKNASKKSINKAIEDTAIEMAGKNVINGKTAFGAFMKHLGGQMLEETGVELSQSIGDALNDIAYNGDTDLSWKELEEVVLLTPLATGPISGPMSASSFKNFSMENIKLAAKKPDVFNKLVDQWVGAAKTDEQRAKRQEEGDFKKGVISELSQTLTAVDELKIIDKDISNKLLEKAVQIVEKKQEIKNAKSDQAKGVFDGDLAKLQSEAQALIQEGYDKKTTIDQRIEQSKKDIAERDARLAARDKEEADKRKAKELDAVKNNPEFQRLNIVPDNDNNNMRPHSLPTSADFVAIHTDNVSESELGNGLSLKVASLPTETTDQGDMTTDAIVVDSDGNTKAQFKVYGDTPVAGAIELDAVVDEKLQGSGISTKTYQAVANKTGKPILPASINRDYRGKKNGSTLSKKSALFWKSLQDKGLAEEVEVTTNDGKVLRTLAVLPEGFTSTSTVKKIEDTGAENSNVESEKFTQKEEVQTDMANGTFVLNRKGTPVTYKIVKFHENEKGDIVSVETTDPTGKTKFIRAEGVLDELKREKLIHENKLIENGITEEELIQATTDSGARSSEQLSSEGTDQNTETDRREQKFKQGKRADILKQSVNYQGIQGRLLQGEDGAYYVMAKDGQMILVEGGESSATNEELGLTMGKTNLELTEESLAVADADRAAIRRQLYDLYWKFFNKQIGDATGEFADAIRNIGDTGPASVASKLIRAVGLKISGPARKAIGQANIKKVEDLAIELGKLDLLLSNKNRESLKEAARDLDIKNKYRDDVNQLKAERKAKEDAARKRSQPVTPSTVPPKSRAGVTFSLKELTRKLKERFGIPTKVVSREQAMKEIQKKYPRLMFSIGGGVVGEYDNSKALKEIQDFADEIGFNVKQTKDKNYAVYFDSLGGTIYVNSLNGFDIEKFKDSLEAHYMVDSTSELITAIKMDALPIHSLISQDEEDVSYNPSDLNEDIVENLINVGKINWFITSANESMTMALIEKYYNYLEPTLLITNPGITFEDAVKVIETYDSMKDDMLQTMFLTDGIRLAERKDFTKDKLKVLMHNMGFGTEEKFIDWCVRQAQEHWEFESVYNNPILLDLVFKYTEPRDIEYQKVLASKAFTEELYSKYKDKIKSDIRFYIRYTESIWINPDMSKTIANDLGLLDETSKIVNYMSTDIPTEQERIDYLLEIGNSNSAFDDVAPMGEWSQTLVTKDMLPKLEPWTDTQRINELAVNSSVNPADLIQVIKDYANKQDSEVIKMWANHQIRSILNTTNRLTLDLILDNLDIYSIENIADRLKSVYYTERVEKGKILTHFFDDIKPFLSGEGVSNAFDWAPSEYILNHLLTKPVKSSNQASGLLSMSDIKFPENSEVSHIFPLYTHRSIKEIVKYWRKLWSNGQSTIESATTTGVGRNIERIRDGQARIVFNKETSNFTAYSPTDNFSNPVSSGHSKLVQVKTATRSSVHTNPTEISNLLEERITYGHDEWLIRLTPGSIDFIEYMGVELPDQIKLLNADFGIKIKHINRNGEVIRVLDGNMPSMLLAQRADDGSIRGYYDRVSGEAILVDGEASPTTSIHEAFSHPFVEKAKRDNPKLYNNLLAEAKKQTDVVKAVNAGYSESTQEDRDAEYITHAIDKYVNNELDKNKDKTLIQAIKDFFKYVSDELKKILNIDTTVGDLSPNLTLQDLAHYALYGEGKMDLRPTQTTTATEVKLNTDGTLPNEEDAFFDKILNDIADHIQNGTVAKMTDIQFAIYDLHKAEVNQILAKRDAEGSYTRKTAAKATEDALSIIERRNNQIGRVLKSIGFTQDKIDSTITVFDEVAKRWAKRNNKPIEDFYNDVFKGIEVADLGEGKKGATVQVDGGYIIQLTNSATVNTPVHELAHIFQNFLTKAEQKAVLDWLGHEPAKDGKWKRETSEGFAKGFEKWLMDAEDVPDLLAFKRFKEWLTDIYKGVVNFAGQSIPSFTPDVKRLYTSILTHDVEPHTQKAYNEAIGRNNTLLDRMRKEGVQFKKATFEDILSKVGLEAKGWDRFKYLPRKMAALAQLAVKGEFTDPIKANTYAQEQQLKMQQDPDHLPNMMVHEALGYGYALTQMEAAYEKVIAKLKKAPKNKDLLELQDELSRSIQDLSQVLSIGRSVAGLQLRVGSHNFTHDMYSPQVLKAQAINRWNRPLNAAEEKEIEQHSKYIQDAIKNFKEGAKDLDEATREQLKAMAEQLVSEQFKNSPFMKEAMKVAKSKTPRQRSADINKEYDKLSKMLSDKPDLLYDDKPIEKLFDDDTNDVEFFRSLRSFISMVIAENEKIDSFEKLDAEMEKFFPNISQDKLLNVLVWSDPKYQEARADELASTASVIKKEAKLLDQLRTYLTESYKEIEKTGNKKIYPERLVKLEKFIAQIQSLAATDYTIDTETFNEAIIHLDALQSLYAGLALEKVTFESPNLKDMISKVRDYETARKLDRKEKQLKELEGVIEQLRAGTYEGSLSDIVPQKLDKHTDERLEIIANKIGVSKEVIKSFKEKSNKLEIIKRIGSLLQTDDTGKNLRTFKTVYDAIKQELPEVTKKDVYDAILYKTNPKKIAEDLKTARTNMNNEVKALEKLQNFMKKPIPATKIDANRTILQKELIDITKEIEKLAAVRYENLSSWKIDDLKKKFKDILDNYEGVLTGEITTMSMDDLIQKVQDIKDQELNVELAKQTFQKILDTKKTKASLDTFDNIFELVPELLPKTISDENLKQKGILSQEVKHERLLRVNKMFDLVRDLVTSNDVKAFTEENSLYNTEFKALKKFLEIEKKSKDIKPELVRLNREVYLKRSAFNEWLEANHTATGTTLLMNFLNTPRLLTLSADISFVTYQGGTMLFSHPLIAAQAFGKMALAAFSHKKWQQQLADIKLDPFYTIAVASGLKLVDELSLTLEEELHLTSILENWSLTKKPAKTLRRFGERLYSSYMNHLRLGAFIDGMKKLEAISGGFIGVDENFYAETDQFLQNRRDVVKKLASDVNMHTGSANTFTGNETIDEGINQTLDGASWLFIAPRLYASVYRSTMAMTLGLGVDAVRVLSNKDDVKANPMKGFYQYRFRENMRKLAGLAGWHIAMLCMFTGVLRGLFGGDDDEKKELGQTVFNPYSSQFLKVKSGQRIFSISPFVSYYRFAARLGFQAFINDGVGAEVFERSREMEKKTGFVDHVNDFMRYRWNPIVGGVIDAGIYNRDWNNKPISKYSLFSEDVGWAFLDRTGAVAKRSLVPIWGQGVFDNIQRRTFNQILPEFAIDFTGINAYTVEPYQDTEVRNYLTDKKFKLSYDGIPKSIDRPDDIKADVKMEFGEWIKSEIENGRKPSKGEMQLKNRQILRMKIEEAQ
jgi:hypothetical protein